jgi:hypothetical protein
VCVCVKISDEDVFYGPRVYAYVYVYTYIQYIIFYMAVVVPRRAGGQIQFVSEWFKRVRATDKYRYIMYLHAYILLYKRGRYRFRTSKSCNISYIIFLPTTTSSAQVYGYTWYIISSRAFRITIIVYSNSAHAQLKGWIVRTNQKQKLKI